MWAIIETSEQMQLSYIHDQNWVEIPLTYLQCVRVISTLPELSQSVHLFK